MNPAQWYHTGKSELEPLLESLPQKALTTTDTFLYAAILYHLTGSQREALTLHSTISSKACFVLAMDEYHETGNEKKMSEAHTYHLDVQSALGSSMHTLLDLEKKIAGYFTLEKQMAKKLHTGPITQDEIKQITLRKSTDAFLYIHILNSRQQVPRAIKHELYARQLMRDLQDDIADLPEDVQRGNPNPILLGLCRNATPYTNTSSRRIAEESGVVQEHCNLVNSYIARIRSAEIPGFEWIREIDIS